MRKFWLILNLSLFLVLSFCVSREKEISIQPALDDAQQHFAQGDFQMAIEAFSIARQKYPRDETVLKSYIRILEEIKISADKAFEEKKYDQAEKHYSVLMQNYPRFKQFQQSLSFDSKALRLGIRECLIAGTRIRVQKAMQEGDYSKAIDTYRKALETYPGGNFLKNDLIQTATEIHSRAENALEGEDYKVAGKAFFSLLKDYRWLNNSVPPLPFFKTSLEDRIKSCGIELTKEGLKQYREGNIKEAITIWKDILEFDPENTEIKKAIVNAKEQLKKIKK
jgi:tetratricopeptide (TPR) repeat protein